MYRKGSFSSADSVNKKKMQATIFYAIAQQTINCTKCDMKFSIENEKKNRINILISSRNTEMANIFVR